MRRAKLQSRMEILQALVLGLVASGCTGVLNDPSVRNGMGIVLLDDEPNKYMWKTTEEIRGNKAEVTIPGECSPDIPQVSVTASLETGGPAVTFNVPCTNGQLSAAFTGANKFPANGRYKLVFAGSTDDVAAAKSEVSKIYDFYKVENPAQMVGLQCTGVQIASPHAETAIPFVNIDECSISKDDDFRLDGTCTPESKAHFTTVKINSSIDKTCDAPFSELFASLTTGPHLIPVAWEDPWGNNFSRTLLIKKLSYLDYQSGGVSFLASGSFDSSHAQTTLALVVGTPFVPVASDVTNAIPFSRGPASSANGLEMAPGFLSLVYGLSSDD